METIKTANRLHPLMAAAALSVVTVSLAGTAAITGLLPSSIGAPAPQAALAMSAQATTAFAAPVPATLTLAAAPAALAAAPLVMAAPAPAAAPVVVQKKPVAKRVVQRARPAVHHHHRTERSTRLARNDAPTYRQASYRDADYRDADYRAPAPQPAARQPSYLGIGAGALIGGLLGNQVGGGNGKKLATVAGIIGGGMLGNEIANRNGQ